MIYWTVNAVLLKFLLSKDGDPDVDDVFNLWAVLMWRIGWFGVNMLQTCRILKKFRPLLNIYRGHATTDVIQLVHRRTLDMMQHSQTKRVLTMKEALKDEDAFDIFVDHCSRGMSLIYNYPHLQFM